MTRNAGQEWILVPAPIRPSVGYNPVTNRLVVALGINDTGFVNGVLVLVNANGTGGTPTWANPIADGANSYPPGRQFQASAYNSADNRLIIFGGSNLNGDLNDVWILSNADASTGNLAWNELTAANAPSARRSASAAYDPKTNSLIVYGGDNSPTPEVWVPKNANGLGGAPTWKKLTPSGGGPVGAIDATAVYDPGSNRLTLWADFQSARALRP